MHTLLVRWSLCSLPSPADTEVPIANAGLLQNFAACASEHLGKMQMNLLQQHDAHSMQQAMSVAQTISDAAELLLHTIHVVHTQQPPQLQIETVRRCAQSMLTLVFGIVSNHQAMPVAGNALVGDLCQCFAQQHGAHTAAIVARQLQHSAQSLAARLQGAGNV